VGSPCGAARGDAPGAGPRGEDRGDSTPIENGKIASRILKPSETISNTISDLKYL
jgi:hypothetical protein